jgi:2-keto-4-pentenoate hydratase/2-oxohepta-3-ene-1,7-dioic acid hydratase in catechol pathway
MRLARHGNPGQERPIASPANSEAWYDVSGVVDDIDAAFFAGGGLRRTADALAAGNLERVPNLERFGPPAMVTGKVVCIGLNYRDHAAETNATVPTEPVIFFKAADTVGGPDDTVLIPRGSTKTDWEVELAIVIGAEARYLDSPADSAGVIAGYAISDDVSEREFQLERGGQWDKGKSCETFNPFGPWILTADEVADPQALGLRLWVNDVLRQDGTTKNMVFGVHHIVWYVSQFMVLRPGDIINTGTPAGVALGLPDHPYLREGDIVQTEIDGLGRQRHVFGQA